MTIFFNKINPICKTLKLISNLNAFNVELRIPEILDLAVYYYTCILMCICVRVCLYSHKCGIFRYISWHLMDLVAQTEETASCSIK